MVACRAAVIVLLVVAGLSAAARPDSGPVDLAALLARVGAQVEHYFARAQSVICLETVRLQPLDYSLAPNGGPARQVVYDLRISWERAGDGQPLASVLREIVSVNGRAPRPRDEPGCMDPKPVSPEPLAMLLPARQRESAFTWAGIGRLDGQPAAMLDYKSLETGPPKVARHKECISVEVPGRSRGRVWVDQQTGDVLRLDEHLTGMVDFDVPEERSRRVERSMVLERADSSTRYKRVTFHDPEETLILPASIDTLTVIRNSGVPRLRKTQVFSNYRRFVTDGRIVPQPEVK